jgi:aminobenzoyl-glutamate utilization protein B
MSIKRGLPMVLLVVAVSGGSMQIAERCARAAPTLDELKRQAIEAIDGRRVFTQQMVDQIFSFSELGFEEQETSRYVTDLLQKQGFKIEQGVAGIPTAWTATWGTGKPVIGFIADLDCIPDASQKPGVAYRDPIVVGAPGHGEGHNAGQAVNVTAALVLKELMETHKLSGTLKILPGVAEELLATKAYLVRAGVLKNVDAVLGAHVDSEFSVTYGQRGLGLVSVQYSFHGTSAHAGGSPWKGLSALDAVELMNVGWNYRREHLPLEHRSHYVVINGGDQPNVVPANASVWYFFRQTDAAKVKELYDLGSEMARGATIMTGTTFDKRVVGSAWPDHFNKVIAEAEQKNIERIGVPSWDAADQSLAKGLQAELGSKVEGLKTKVPPLEVATSFKGGSDDIGDISWAVPTVYLRYPANMPGLPGHNWANGVSMATPIAHKGTTAGAKAQALTALDLMLSPDLVKKAWDYFRNVQTKTVKYTPLMAPSDKPLLDANKLRMEKYRPALRAAYYDPTKYKTYMEQLGVRYPTIRTTKKK